MDLTVPPNNIDNMRLKLKRLANHGIVRDRAGLVHSAQGTR
ncbi:hypothetical protein ACRAWF_47135 [Streptomyces sp. L7]